MKKSLFLVFSLLFSSARPFEIDQSNLFVPNSLNPIKVFHDNTGFTILKEDKIYSIQNAFIDKELRNITDIQLQYLLGNIKRIELNGQTIVLTKISDDQCADLDLTGAKQLSQQESNELIAQLSSSAYLVVTQLSDGQFSIQLHQRLLGGGFFGAHAGFWIGKVLTHVVAQVGIFTASAVVGIVCPPAAGPIFYALEAAIVPAAETTSNAIGLATGIAGAVMTGPV